MKKIKYLCGILGLFSAVSFQSKADIDLQALTQAGTQDGTNFFTAGQTGEIPVKGKLVTPLTDVKFIVFSAPDGLDLNNAKTGTGINSELQLPDFRVVSSTEKDVKAGFAKDPDLVYVKRVQNDEIIDLEPTDKIAFKVKLDSAYTEVNGQLKWVQKGYAEYLNPLLLLKKDKLEEYMKRYNDGKEPTIVYNANTQGPFTVEGKVYNPNSLIQFRNDTDGILKISNYPVNNANGTTMDAIKFESLFSKAENIEFSILVQVR